MRTIVYNDARGSQRRSDVGERLDDGIGVCEITLDVKLVRSVAGFGLFPRRQSYLVTFGCESFGYTAADSRASTKDENHWGC